MTTENLRFRLPVRSPFTIFAPELRFGLHPKTRLLRGKAVQIGRSTRCCKPNFCLICSCH